MNRIARIVACLAPVLLLGAVAWAGDTDPIYRVPDQTLVDIVDAPPTPWASLSPDRETMLLVEQPSLPSIAELSDEELRLAGYRINPRLFGPSRSRPDSGLELLDVASGKKRDVKGLPENVRLDNPTWAPDGSRVAFTVAAEEGHELWVLDVKKAKASRLTGPVLNLCAGASPEWSADGKSVYCTVKPENLGAAPVENRVPTGPVIQENLGEKAPNRTYQDLLTNAFTEMQFDYYFTSQLARVDLSGKLSRLSEPLVIDSFEPSPDGNYVLVQSIHRPYSYLVPAERFPRTVEVLDTKGARVALVADLPLHENVPIAFGSVPTGPRDHAWRNDAPATLVWVEALDGGDAAAEAEKRDRLFVQDAPFTGEPRPWLDLDLRYGGTQWGTGDVALVSTWWWATRRTQTFIASPDRPQNPPVLLWDRSWQDRYSDPGNPVMDRNAWGRQVLRLDGNVISLTGTGASDEGDRPFYDTLDLVTKETKRHFRSEAPYYERPVVPIGNGQVITRRESVDEVPNYFVRDLRSGDLRQLTHFPHPSPQLAGLTKELVKYTRADGVPLTGTLYLPPGYDREKDGALPCVMWAYPTEYKSADDAGQVRDSPYRFDRVGWWSPLLFLTQGYCVLDDPSMPIIGEGDEEPNDTFREQLVSSAQAAVDYVVERGVAQRDAIAIGGHSYGAFMTANLLAHSDLFAAGIARSGAYNRTLTPFGFQSEERSLWEAPEIYFSMSPFMHAEKVNEPLLLIHGDSDNNSGTFPMQSERYFDALKGQGAVARLVMLPKESHGYRARESILHMLWEQEEWLDRYVKRDVRSEEPASTR
ncbi:MAG: S9 family peptidase [Gemmatimonadetes bacterium]|nr:S9 family peptidase [Gemmatimonadota bacterium]